MTSHSNIMLSSLPWCIVILASLVAAVIDVRHAVIPNRITIPLFIGGLIFSLWTGGNAALIGSITASLLIALPFIILFVLAGGGAGDAKLMGAVGAWLGWNQSICVLLAVMISGVILAIIVAAVKGTLPKVCSRILASFSLVLISISGRTRLDRKHYLPANDHTSTRMPYGPAIFAGICIAALWNIL